MGDDYAVVVAIELESCTDLAVYPCGAARDDTIYVVRSGVIGNGHDGGVVEFPPTDQVTRASGSGA